MQQVVPLKMNHEYKALSPSLLDAVSKYVPPFFHGRRDSQFHLRANAGHYRRRENIEAETNRLRDRKTRLVAKISVQESRLSTHSSSLRALTDKISGQDAELSRLRIECERQVAEVARLLADVRALEKQVRYSD